MKILRNLFRTRREQAMKTPEQKWRERLARADILRRQRMIRELSVDNVIRTTEKSW